MSIVVRPDLDPEAIERVMKVAETYRATFNDEDVAVAQTDADLLDELDKLQVTADQAKEYDPANAEGPYNLSTEDRLVLSALRRDNPSTGDEIWAEVYG